LKGYLYYEVSRKKDGIVVGLELKLEEETAPENIEELVEFLKEQMSHNDEFDGESLIEITKEEWF